MLIGGTGTGKSHLAIAIARASIRGGARGRFYTVVDLVNRLESEARASRQGRLAEYLTRMDFIVLDELGYLPFAQTGGQLLFHLMISRLSSWRRRTRRDATIAETALPLVVRKTRLASLLHGAPNSLRYNDHQIGHVPAFHRLACERGLEGIVSKRTNGRYEPDRRTWLKTKCLNREEFVVVGWSDPEGSRHGIGSLLLGYYTPEGKLIYAGRAGTGMPEAELERLWQRLLPLAIEKMPIAIPPPRGSRFGSPLVLSRVHWVRPEMVVEVSYVEWTPDGLLRHVVYLGERQDKLAREVSRSPPHSGET